MRRLVSVAVIVLAALCTDASAAGAGQVRGSFSGHTSQPGRYYKVRFRAAGSRIKGEKFVWLAPCRRGGFLRTATSQGRTPIAIRQGEWSVRGHYTGRIDGYTDHFDVVRNQGKFVSPKEAKGSFRVKVRVFRHGRPYDRCDTGIIGWTAKKHA